MWWGRANSFREIIPKTITNCWTRDGTAGNQSKWQSWLPAGFDQDCPQHPRINQRVRTTAMSPEERRRGRKDGDATWHGRKFMSATQKNSRPPGGESYSWLSSVHHHSCERAFAPSMNKQPVLLLFRALSPPSLPLCLSLASGYPIFLSPTLFLPRCRSSQRVQRDSEKTLLIYDKMEDSGYPVMTDFSSGFT